MEFGSFFLRSCSLRDSLLLVMLNCVTMKNSIFKSIGTVLLLAVAIALVPKSQACTRVVYTGDSALHIVGRSLDWKTPIPTNLYVYPAGMQKVSSSKPGAFTWKSRYGSVYAVSYDAGITEGMNEKGLSVAGLFCKTAIYSDSTNNDRKPISLAVFVAWLLDLNETADQVIGQLKGQDFTLSGATFDGGTETKLHFGVTDASGKTAIIEFEGGKMNIYDPGDIHCMTNDPEWPRMKAIVEYWRKIGGIHMLPGGVRSPDRCVRGAFFIDNVECTADADLGATITRSVMMNVSVPYLYTVVGEPNVSSTQWRSLCNLRDLRYYFDVATNNGFYYIDLQRCNLRPGASVMKLDVAHHPDLTGCGNKALVKCAPFTPIY